MMNVVALAMLLSSLGSVIVLSPEPMLVRSTGDGESPMEAVREAAQGSRQKVEEAVAAAKDTVVHGVEGVTRPVERSLGWLTKKKKPTPADHLAAAREKAADAREAFQDASAHLKDATVEKFGSAAESGKETGKYVGDKISQTVGSAKDAAGTAEELAVDSAQTVYNKAYDSAAATGDKAGSAIGRTASRAKEGMQEMYDSAAETFGSAKEKAGEAKDKVYEGAEAAHDALVDNVQYGVDKSKGTATDAAEKVKETGEHAAHEAGQGILGRVKDAACKTAECLRARAHEAGSLLPNLGQGVGYAYNDRKAAGDTTADSLTKTDAAENARDWTRDTARQSFKSAADTAGDYYQEGRDWAEEKYNSGRDTVREYYDEAGRRYRSARDYYDAPPEYYRGRHQYRDHPPPRYYDDFYDHPDRARYAYRSGRDYYYDDGRDRYIPGRYYGAPRWRVPDRHADESLDDLEAVVESMGWRRVGKVPKDHVGVKSAKEVVIGDTKYVWQGRGQPRSDELHDTVFHHTNLGHENDDPLAKHPRYWEGPDDHGTHKIGSEADDESIVTKGARNLKQGVKNAGQAYEAQRSKAGEYADEARQELSSFAQGNSPESKSLGRHLRSWKDVFIRKPVGILLALTRALHLFTFSTVYGSAIWVTFVSGLVLSKHVPRQQFGYVQSRMFPVYLRIVAVGEVVLLVLHSLLHPWFSSESIEQVQLLNFVAMITATLLNFYVVEPQATKVMFERLKAEEGRGIENADNPLEAKQLMEDQKKKLVSINEEFKTLHGYSSALNLISLGGLTCHLWHLASRLVV